MTLDESSSERLLQLCRQLPNLPPSDTDLEREVRFALACLAARRQALEGQAHGGGLQDVSTSRCEIEALDAARQVLRKLCEPRLGRRLDGA
jgi:hypothetical protein